MYPTVERQVYALHGPWKQSPGILEAMSMNRLEGFQFACIAETTLSCSAYSGHIGFLHLYFVALLQISAGRTLSLSTNNFLYSYKNYSTKHLSLEWHLHGLYLIVETGQILQLHCKIILVYIYRNKNKNHALLRYLKHNIFMFWNYKIFQCTVTSNLYEKMRSGY